MFESPYLDEVIQMGIAQRLPKFLDEALTPFVATFISEYDPNLRARSQAEFRIRLEARICRDFIQRALEVRFGEIPADRLAPVEDIRDRARLQELHMLAATCPSLEAFLEQPGQVAGRSQIDSGGRRHGEHWRGRGGGRLEGAGQEARNVGQVRTTVGPPGAFGWGEDDG